MPLRFALLALAIGACAPGAAAQVTKIPTLEVMAVTHPYLLRKLSGRTAFGSSVTRELWRDLPSDLRRCSERILSAQLAAMRNDALRADRLSRNCHVDEGRIWVRDRLTAFEKAMDAGRIDGAQDALGSAIAALHAFYAFSNYVELKHEKYEVKEHAPVDHVFTTTLSIDSARLTSDFNANASPNRCGEAKPVLDKRGRNTIAGKKRLASWGSSAHAAAVQLALEDTGALLDEILKRRPAFRDACGADIVFGFITEEMFR